MYGGITRYLKVFVKVAKENLKFGINSFEAEFANQAI